VFPAALAPSFIPVDEQVFCFLLYTSLHSSPGYTLLSLQTAALCPQRVNFFSDGEFTRISRVGLADYKGKVIRLPGEHAARNLKICIIIVMGGAIAADEIFFESPTRTQERSEVKDFRSEERSAVVRPT
jgi:hypothetical protein